MCKLGINIDHVATLRNARGQFHPDPLKAALILKECKVDSITMHLRAVSYTHLTLPTK